ERDAEAADLVRADDGRLAGEFAAADALDEEHELLDRANDGAAQQQDDDDGHADGGDDGADGRDLAFLIDLAGAGAAGGDAAIGDFAHLTDEGEELGAALGHAGFDEGGGDGLAGADGAELFLALGLGGFEQVVDLAEEFAIALPAGGAIGGEGGRAVLVGE